MLLNIAAIIVGFILLVWGADRFIAGAGALARNLGVSSLLIGLTVVGFGTSAPEILVSGMAAIQGNSGLAIGNAIGSNIANIALILGVAALVSPLDVHSRTLRREYPILLVVSFGVLALMLDNYLGRIDGVILLIALATVLWLMYRIAIGDRARSTSASDPLESEFDEGIPRDMSMREAVIWFSIGLLVLLGSSKLLVWGAVNLALSFGVSDLIIGLTIVALGTSLPELAASVTGALKNEHDIAIGNVIGSNIYNLLAVLSMPALFSPTPVASDILARDLPMMLGLTLGLLAMAWGPRGQGRITRVEGGLLTASYLGYQGLLIAQASGLAL